MDLKQQALGFVAGVSLVTGAGAIAASERRDPESARTEIARSVAQPYLDAIARAAQFEHTIDMVCLRNGEDPEKTLVEIAGHRTVMVLGD
jgi:hypothetical protein